MNRRNFLSLTGAVAVSGCKGFNPEAIFKAVEGVNQIPVARQALIDYLSPFELEAIKGELAFLDGLLAKVVVVLQGESDISLTNLVSKTLGAPAQVVMIEGAYSAIKSAVIRHNTNTGDPVPQGLVDFDATVTPLYTSIKETVLAQEQVKRGIELLKLLKYVAVLA